MAEPLAKEPSRLVTECYDIAELPGKLKLVALMGRGAVRLTLTNANALELARLISAALGARGVDRVADRGVTALDRQLLRAETQMRADTLRAALRRLKRTAWISGAVLTAWLVFVFLVLGGMT